MTPAALRSVDHHDEISGTDPLHTNPDGWQGEPQGSLYSVQLHRPGTPGSAARV